MGDGRLARAGARVARPKPVQLALARARLLGGRALVSGGRIGPGRVDSARYVMRSRSSSQPLSRGMWLLAMSLLLMRQTRSPFMELRSSSSLVMKLASPPSSANVGNASSFLPSSIAFSARQTSRLKMSSLSLAFAHHALKVGELLECRPGCSVGFCCGGHYEPPSVQLTRASGGASETPFGNG